MLAFTWHISSSLIGVLVGAAAVVAGQFVAHRYSEQREARKEVVDALDSLVAAFVGVDRRVSEVLGAVGLEQPRDAILRAADAVSDEEQWVRAQFFSLRLRLKPDDPVIAAFQTAQHLYASAYIATGPMLVSGKEEAMDEARDLFDQARTAFDAAMETARRAFPRLGQ